MIARKRTKISRHAQATIKRAGRDPQGGVEVTRVPLIEHELEHALHDYGELSQQRESEEA